MSIPRQRRLSIIPSSDATHIAEAITNSEHFRRCLHSVCDADQTVSALKGDGPRREPRTTWQAKPLFDHRLECVDERAAPSVM